MRMKAKHNELSDDFLKPLNLTNDDLKKGLKLPLNAYSGCLRAKFNKLYDNLQGFSICATGQMLLLQLIHDLKEVPTVDLCSCNTDAVMYTIEEEYQKQALKVLNDWQELTGLELEEDNIMKIIMRDVNNYVSILKVKDEYEVHYKGGEFRGNHIFEWDKENKRFNYTFKDDLKNNSMTIVSEAILKNLLFNIPVEETINNCNDIFRFQIISHLGSTYEKCVQESETGDIELQRNNRIYAGNIKSGTIIKIKPDGRRDSLANCPTNPIVDNANKLTINDINKNWYIDLANQRINDFLGVKRLENYKKEELLEMAKQYNLDIDKKTKKEDIIKIIKEKKKGNDIMATKQELEERLTKATEQNEKLVEKMKEMEVKQPMSIEIVSNSEGKGLYHKINELRKEIREMEFIYDKELPSNLGGGEYYGIDQFYNAIQNACIEAGLDFSFETTELIQFDKELTKPAGKLPIHVATVKTLATLTDIETGESKNYITIAQGSDTIDKAVASASSMAFRNWFYKNFTPKDMKEDELDNQDVEKSEAPKVPVYVPEKKKEEIKEKVVEQVQQEDSDDEDIKIICDNIMKIREKINDDSYGENVLKALTSGILSSTDILEIDLKVKNKMEKVGL